MVTLREKYPLESRKPLKKTIGSVFGGSFRYFIVVVVIGVFIFVNRMEKDLQDISHFTSPYSSWIIYTCVGIIILLIALKYIYEIFYLKYYFYDLVGKNLIIKKGVFSRNEITLPINRIQDVYVDQDILDRIFGLWDVHVSSATTISGSLSHIDGLNKDNAQAIKNLILSGIHKENG